MNWCGGRPSTAILNIWSRTAQRASSVGKPDPLQPLPYNRSPGLHVPGNMYSWTSVGKSMAVVFPTTSASWWSFMTSTLSGRRLCQCSMVTLHVMVRILDGLFVRWGVPRAITTDNGPQMTSAEFYDFLASRGVKHIRTAFYHPQANGGVERFNATLKNGIRAHLAQGCAFEETLNQTLLHYRASHHSTTLVSPAFLIARTRIGTAIAQAPSTK